MSPSTDSLDLRRIQLLLSHSLWLNKRRIWIVLSCWGAAYLVLELFFGFLIGAHRAAPAMLYFPALLAGWIHTSGAFSDYHDRLRAPVSLMLPASTAEKFFARWLLTAIAYPVVVALIASILHQATYLAHSTPAWHVTVNGQVEDLAAPEWTLLPLGGPKLLLIYLIGHALFLWGSVHFERYQLPLTILCICGLALLLLLANLLLHNLSLISTEQAPWEIQNLIDRAIPGLKTGFWIALSALALALAYRNFRRLEA